MSKTIFGENLRYFRKKKGLSQTQFVKKIKLPDGNVIKRPKYAAWEEGRAYPSTRYLPPLCDALGVKDALALLTQPMDPEKMAQ